MGCRPNPFYFIYNFSINKYYVEWTQLPRKIWATGPDGSKTINSLQIGMWGIWAERQIKILSQNLKFVCVKVK